MSSFLRLWQVLVDRARQDPELAAVMRELVDDLASVLNGVASEGPPVAEEPTQAVAASEPTVEDAATKEELERLVRHLREGGAHGDIVAPASRQPEGYYSATTDAVLAPLAARFHAKARIARWHSTGADPARLDELRSRIGEVDGLDRTLLDPVPGGTLENWGYLADTCEAAATAADLLSAFADAGTALLPGSLFAEALVAAAEAQSSVRSAYWALRGRHAGSISPDPTTDDPDQLGLFRWLREATQVDQIYVEHHMRWQDPATPQRAGEVEAHLREIATRAGISLRDPRATTIGKLLKSVAYHSERLANDPDYWDAENERESLFRRIREAVDAGVPATDGRLRKLLLPIGDTLPDADDPSLPPPVRRVLEALYEHHYRVEEASARVESDDTARMPDHVMEAAQLLAGKHLAIFGGEKRPNAVTAIENAFGSTEVEWVATREHQSTAPFEAVVARSDVAVLLKRWSSHSFQDINGMCTKHNVLYVSAPGGYNPSAIAYEILHQAGDKLRGNAT